MLPSIQLNSFVILISINQWYKQFYLIYKIIIIIINSKKSGLIYFLNVLNITYSINK